MNEITLQNKDGKILASSREVAERFGKQNKHVNESIRKLMVENSTVKNMFENTTYISNRGREENEYLMDRDGFSLLVMGFTGKKALEWKLKYIEAFNKMEEKLKSSSILSDEEKLRLQLFSKDPAEAVYAHNKLVELATAPLKLEITDLKTENAILKPKSEFYDQVADTDDVIDFGSFADTLSKEYGIEVGRTRLFTYCRQKGYLCSTERLHNKPKHEMIQRGYMLYKTSMHKEKGKWKMTCTPYLTGRGQIWLAKHFVDDYNAGYRIINYKG